MNAVINKIPGGPARRIPGIAARPAAFAVTGMAGVLHRRGAGTFDRHHPCH